MHRKQFCTLFLLCLSATLFAFTDSFASNGSDSAYTLLIKSIKDDQEEGVVLAHYVAYLNTHPDMVNQTRIEYQLCRYFKDNRDKNEAREHLAIAYEKLEQCPEGMGREIAEAEVCSADYYVNGKMKVGIRSSDLTKELYRKYPEEVTVALMEANRILYTPAIAGGSSRKALALFEEIEKDSVKLQDLDRFSLLAGIGVAYHNRGNHATEAKAYIDRAMAIYGGDRALLKVLDEIAHPETE